MVQPRELETENVIQSAFDVARGNRGEIGLTLKGAYGGGSK